MVRDVSGLCAEDIRRRISEHFEIREVSDKEWRPRKKGEVGMYISENSSFYMLELSKEESLKRKEDPVESLDASVLQELVLSQVFSIEDPRTDKRIEFVGGIRGDRILKEKADSCKGVAFLMYPTSIEELMKVADAGLLMPPKSTWFEPKLRSGLLIHEF